MAGNENNKQEKVEFDFSTLETDNYFKVDGIPFLHLYSETNSTTIAAHTEKNLFINVVKKGLEEKLKEAQSTGEYQEHYNHRSYPLQLNGVNGELKKSLANHKIRDVFVNVHYLLENDSGEKRELGMSSKIHESFYQLGTLSKILVEYALKKE